MAYPITTSAPSSPESVYLSFEEDSDSDVESQPLVPTILRSTGAAALHTESATVRALLCINAARLLLLETQKNNDATALLKAFRKGPALHRILSIGITWPELEIDNADDIFALPLFSSSIEPVNREFQPGSLQSITQLVKQLQRMAASAVIDGVNDTITVIGLPGKRNEPRTTFVVFNPRCRSSQDLNGASLRSFSNPRDTAQHIFNLLDIHKTPEPTLMHTPYNVTICRLVDQVFTEVTSVDPEYKVNMQLLHESRRLELVQASESEARREMDRVNQRMESVDNEMKGAMARTNRLLGTIYSLEVELANVHAMTAAMFDDVQREDPPMEDRDVEMEDLTASFNPTDGWKDGSSSKSPPSSFNTVSSASVWRGPISEISDNQSRRRPLTPDTPPETLWNVEQEASLLREREKKEAKSREEALRLQAELHEKQKKDEETRLELLRLQAQQEEEERSAEYARQLAMEEENETREFEALKQANKSFECPICMEEYHEGFMVVVDRCEHTVCRECVLHQVKSQIEEAHWPIFCPMCPGTEEKRGVITRHAAELVGGDEKLFEAWNRMELGAVSIALECPRCKETTRVDTEDFREAEFLDCPLGCGAHWCKDCHQEVERGKKHSCDGQAEFDELAKSQNWKPCPGCGAMAERVDGCNQLSCKVPGCNSHFCYVCGGLIAKTTSIMDMIRLKSEHYQNCRLWN